MPEASIIDSIRWQQKPTRVVIGGNGGSAETLLQTTASVSFVDLCRGRPVEEVPRIAPVMGPSHHVVAAMALDRLFQVAPPELATNMRKALVQAQFLTHHLRKLYFLISHWTNPLISIRSKAREHCALPHAFEMMRRIMTHLAMAQEAETILGGRPEHPLTAVGGGVSRYLKEDHHPRLTDIAASCVDYSTVLADYFFTSVFTNAGVLNVIKGPDFDPLSALCLSEAENIIVLHDAWAAEKDRFGVDRFPEKIDFCHENWTRTPFGHARANGGSNTERTADGQLFFTGPLARLNRGFPFSAAAAEQERQRLIATLGPLPRHEVPAAYWALVIEVLQAAADLQQFCEKEKLTGPALRTIPTKIGTTGAAALESPSGVICHHYTVDERGIVKEVFALDTDAANNGLRCRLARAIVAKSLSRGGDNTAVKRNIELGLLPF